jgi:RNA exonuclease 4
MDLTNLSSNWKNLQVTLAKSKSIEATSSLKRKRPSGDHKSSRKIHARNEKMSVKGDWGSLIAESKDSKPTDLKGNSNPIQVNNGLSQGSGTSLLFIDDLADYDSVEIGRYVAIDCEMVGVGPNPERESALARVSVVNFDGVQLYDSYVQPREEVTDWRTPISGILPKHMNQARSLTEVQHDIHKLLKDRILVGHAVRHDLDALLLSHPKRDIRDTARHPPYRKLAGGGSPKLKILASELLGLDIQSGQHSSVEDAQACMLLFRRDKAAFENEHGKRWPPDRNGTTTEDTSRPETGSERTGKKKKKKKKKR